MANTHTHIVTACGRCPPETPEVTDVSKQHIGFAPRCCGVALFLYPKKTRYIGSDSLCILLMHFSQVTLKTPCTLTLKSNLALSGLKAHVKLKATLGVGMKNLVAPYINRVERCTQHLDRRNGIF